MTYQRLSRGLGSMSCMVLLSALSYAAPSCPLNQTNPSVTVCTPTPFALVQSPVHIVAGTTDSNTVTVMRVYLDGRNAYQVNASSIDTFLQMATGKHRIVVWAADSTGAKFQQVLTVGMQPPCALNSTNQTVTICSLVSGSVVSSPFHVVAAATDSNPVTSMTLLVDGTNQGSISNSAILDLYVSNLAQGAHSISVQAKDSTGQTFNNQISITLDGANGLSNLNHIIFFVQENHTFDDYYGMLGQYKASIGLANDVDGLELNASVPNTQGQPIHPYHYNTVCTENLNGQWQFSYQALDYGKLDGFAKAAEVETPSTIDPTGTRAMGYYDQSDIPFYYEAASRFATSDRFFSPLLSRTVPNRLYLFAATSFGNVRNPNVPSGGFNVPTIFDRLDQAGVTWRYYYQDTTSIVLKDFAVYQKDAAANLKPIANYFTDINNDATLPAVIFIERSSGLDEHPSNNIQKGAADAAKIINAFLYHSAIWSDSVFILTYDEGGALYDHVLPAREIEPDAIAPQLQSNWPVGAFNQSGFRVPMIVFSPWVKPSFVSHTTRDYTSILRLIEDRFNLPPLTLRDANADNMMEFFDFSQTMTPPSLPSQPVSGTCDDNLEAAPGY